MSEAQMDRGKDPGVCFPWEEKVKEMPDMPGDKAQVERVWKEIDVMPYLYIWHCLVSF